MDTQELLEAFVSAPENNSSKYWEALSKIVRALVHKAVAKREIADLEDFEEDCVVAIWTKINAIRSDENSPGIDNLEAFVRQAVHNRYCDAIRRKRPKWYNLKLELMELFSGKIGVEGFAMWQNPESGVRLCGFSEWMGNRKTASARCREIYDNPAKFASNYLGNRDPQELPTWQLAAAVLDYCGGPVDIDTLTSCIAEITHAKTEEPLSIDAQVGGDEDSVAPVDWLISPDTDVEKQVVDSEWFNHIINWFWKEFSQLSVKQRKAMLYGMSGDQVIVLCSKFGMREVAKSLEISPELLASLINALPLPDNIIAEELGMQTRAVPSVRFKAWGRIRRRIRKSPLGIDD